MKTLFSVSGLVLMTGLFVSVVPSRADQWNKKTVITIDAPVQIPTMTLQPGSYTFKLLDSQSNRHIVTVWDKDETNLLTTIIAVPNYRVTVSGESKFAFWETPAEQPKALRAWFYPGDNFGQEFAYPKAKAQEIASAANADVPAMTSEDETRIRESSATSETKIAQEAAAEVTPPVPETAASSAAATPATVESAPSAAAATASPAPSPAGAPEPAPAPVPPVAAAPAPDPSPAPAEQEPATLPQTASNSREILLLGILAAVTGLATFKLRQQSA